MFGLKSAATNVAVQGGVAVAQAAGTLSANVEVTLMLFQAKGVTKQIATVSKSLSGIIGRTVAEIAIVAEDIIEHIEKNPKDFTVVRSFFDYNLGKAHEVIQARENLADPNEATVAALDKVIGEVKENFESFMKKCKANDIEGAAIASETLSRIIQARI